MGSIEHAEPHTTAEIAPGDIPPRDSAPSPSFAHPSEAEFARILDFYRIKWEYEPHSFALREAPDGRVIERFTPDFYLPEHDIYIELTTLKQSLVTKKNRKLRRLRERYPEIKIKLLYNRDYRNLLLKFGVRPAPSRTEPSTAAPPPAPAPSAEAALEASA